MIEIGFFLLGFNLHVPVMSAISLKIKTRLTLTREVFRILFISSRVSQERGPWAPCLDPLISQSRQVRQQREPHTKSPQGWRCTA